MSAERSRSRFPTGHPMASFTLHGIPVSRGIAIGRAHLLTPAALDVKHYLVPEEQVEAEVQRLRVVQLPPALQVGAAYGLTVRADAPAAAQAFVEALRQPAAQAVLRRLGFGAP